MTGQPALFDPPPPPPQWGVVVDEIRLFSMGRATDWWAVSIAHFGTTGRVRYLAVVPVGSLLEIGPFEQDDAEFVRDHLIENGIDGRVLTLRQWTAQPHLPKCRRAKPCRLCTSAVAAAESPAA